MRDAPSMRAEKTRKIVEFWRTNPKGLHATLGEAQKATGAARSACQRWRTRLREMDHPTPAKTEGDQVQFFDRFQPRKAPKAPPSQQKEKPGAQAPPDPPAEAPPPKPESEDPRKRPREFEFRLW